MKTEPQKKTGLARDDQTRFLDNKQKEKVTQITSVSGCVHRFVPFVN